MKSRTWKIYSAVSEYNFSGLHSTKTTYLTTVPDIVPTVKNIRSVVRSLFPEYEIDETDWTLAEQIRSNFDIGMISVALKMPGTKYRDEFLSRSCELMEVI